MPNATLRRQHTSCDPETRHEVIGHGPDERLPLQRSPVCGDQTVDGNAHDEGDVEPVDVLVPICLGDGLFGDVRLLGVVPLVAIGL